MKKESKISPVDWRSFHPSPVIGVDEVGRGCLAGDVYAAAVILNEETPSKNPFEKTYREGHQPMDHPVDSHFFYTDSKVLSSDQREKICAHILKHHRVGIGYATVEEITRLNILQASLLAMKRAIEALQVKSGHILVDGKFKVPGMPGFQQTPLIKGDLRAEPISAASIVAKVTRDRVMSEMAKEYPHYGFEKHKGYSTVVHKKAIAEQGPCKIHRPSFAGVREFLSIPSSSEFRHRS